MTTNRHTRKHTPRDPNAPPATDEPAPVGFVDPDDCFTRRFVDRPFFRRYLTRIDQYDLPGTEIQEFAGLVVSSQADQDFLYRHRERLRTYLDAGGVVVFSGHLSRQWLPGAGTFVPPRIDTPDDYTVVEARPHPVFEGVSTDDLTYQRGVAGFFARGHNPPPDGATVLLRLRGGEPVVYVDHVTTEGTILVHSGNDLACLDRRDTTAAKVPPQLVSWVRAMSDLLRHRHGRGGTEGPE